MEIIVHKGKYQYDSTFIQLSTSSTTILLDVGQPYGSTDNQVSVPTIDADAVLVCRPHQDHFGLINRLSPKTPVFLGELGKNLIDASHVLLGKKRHRNNFQFYKPWEPLVIGDIRITPYLVDHSAVDAYVFLVEAGGEGILFCGDFRSHGRIGKFLESLANHPLPRIDLMLLEGTILRRSNDDLLTESAVTKRLFKIINEQKNITFIISSAQNTNRIMSAFKACKRACKTLVIDTYTAWVLEQVGEVSEDIPVMEMDGIRVYVDFNQDEKLKASAEFFGDFRQRLQHNRIKWAELTENPSSFVYFGEMSSFRKINAFREGEGPVNVIYSQWLGYLDGTHNYFPGAEQISGFRDDSEINFVYAHTSGHAPLKDLQSLVTSLKPSLIAPINTKLANDFGKSFDNVTTFNDGIPFALNLKSELAGVGNGSEYTKFRANG